MIEPFWNVSSSVGSLCSLRCGGVSEGCYSSLNLGFHTGDNPDCVSENRILLKRAAGVGKVVYVNQIHGTSVLNVDNPDISDSAITADALVTRLPDVALAIMTADCLPVLFASSDGKVVANAHAGWRGLCEGVLENTVSAMNTSPELIHVYMGPCIGQESFEVGPEVREAFLDRDSDCLNCFIPSSHGEKYLADLRGLAVRRLTSAGIDYRNIYGGYFDTYTMPELFFSYRRDGVTGRIASLVWIRQ